MIPQYEPWIGDEEIQQVIEVLKSNWITEGKKTAVFEKEISKIFGVKHAITVNNGTIALYVALKALGIGAGDDVIVPDFTFIASANSVVLTGGRPVFVDVDEKTFNLAPEKIEDAITENTKAIMPVHIYGQSAEMDRVMEIARANDLFVVEDAAQGIKVQYKGSPVGSFGDINAVSFFADKTMTTAEGGAVLTDSDELANNCRILKNQGRTGRGIYFHDKIGYNFRITDLQAALGLAQLSRLDEIIWRKKKNQKLYEEELSGVDGVEFTYVDPRGYNVPFRANILVEDPEGLCSYLEKNDIGSRRFFYPLHIQPCYRTGGEFKNSINAHKRGLSLPSSVRLTEEQILCVCDKIKEWIYHESTRGAREGIS